MGLDLFLKRFDEVGISFEQKAGSIMNYVTKKENRFKQYKTSISGFLNLFDTFCSYM